MARMVFMGTPDFARDSLKALYEANHEIVGVVTNPDRPKGRGMKMVASLVKEYALEKNLPVYQPEKVRNNEEFVQTIKELKPEIICVVAYGKILPKEILDIPQYGCINLHGSLLPQYRGAAPIQWAILNGDKVTGVTTIYMNEEMDAGDIILKEEVEIKEEETTGELWDRLAKVGASVLVKTVEQIEKGIAPREKQDINYTIAPMLTKEMAKIDWETMTTEKIYHLVRGLNPIMGAYTFYEGKKIKLWKVEKASLVAGEEKQKPGTILLADPKQGLVIQTVDGAIRAVEVQGENAKRMQVADFLRGNQLEENASFC